MFYLYGKKTRVVRSSWVNMWFEKCYIIKEKESGKCRTMYVTGKKSRSSRYLKKIRKC